MHNLYLSRLVEIGDGSRHVIAIKQDLCRFLRSVCPYSGCQTVSICQDTRLHVTVMSIIYIALQLYLHDKFCKRIPWHLIVCIFHVKNCMNGCSSFSTLWNHFCWQRYFLCPVNIPSTSFPGEVEGMRIYKHCLLMTLREFPGDDPRSMRPFELRALVHACVKYIPFLDLPFVVATDCSLLNFDRCLLLVFRGLSDRARPPTFNFWVSVTFPINQILFAGFTIMKLDTACRITIKPCVVPETAQWRV